MHPHRLIAPAVALAALCSTAQAQANRTPSLAEALRAGLTPPQNN